MKTITIKGVGKASVKPDLIVVTMRLETEDKEYDKAMKLAGDKIEILNRSLENIGFEKKSVKTTNFNVRTNYENVKTLGGSYKNVLKGYICTHNLKIKFDFDTNLLSKVLLAVSQCLAKPEFFISFTVKDKTAVSQQLLKSVAENAKQKAEVLCDASGVKLGELVNIDYNWGEINVYSNTNYRVDGAVMLKASASPANIEIEPEDINVNDTATFVWEIKD